MLIINTLLGLKAPLGKEYVNVQSVTFFRQIVEPP